MKEESGLIRAFVAVSPPEDVLNRMADFVGGLRPLAPSYKWVSRAQLHLTLRFLGEAPGERITAVSEALTRIAGCAFDIKLTRAGGFPNLARPRALWLGGGTKEDENAKKLADLAAQAEQAAAEAGFPPETKKFNPHLTLARLRSEEPLPEALKERLQNAPAFEWRCDRFFLVKSDLTPRGPIYSILREYPLSEETKQNTRG